jgi:hypothetical protein
MSEVGIKPHAYWSWGLLLVGKNMEVIPTLLLGLMPSAIE